MRAALGDQKLTYLGYSYGTRIGSAYAEAFPQNVRAMILDGAVDPNADPIEADIRQAAAFQTAFNDYAADCAKDPELPARHRPAKAVDVYKSMVEPLVDKPGQDRGSARAELQRRHRRHHPAAVLAQPVAPPHPGAVRAADRQGRHHARAGRPLHGPRRAGALQQLDRRPGGRQLRRRAADHRPRPRSSTRTAAPARPRRS